MRSLARLSLQSRFGLKQHQQVVLEVNNSFMLQSISQLLLTVRLSS